MNKYMKNKITIYWLKVYIYSQFKIYEINIWKKNKYIKKQKRYND